MGYQDTGRTLQRVVVIVGVAWCLSATTDTNTSPDTTQSTAAPTATNTSPDTTQGTAASTATNTSPDTTQSTAAPTATNTSPDTTQGTAAPTATNTSTDTTQGTAAPTATNTSTDTTQGTAAPTATNTSTDTTQGTAAPTATNTSTDTTQGTAAPTATNTSTDTTQGTAAPTATNTSPDTTQGTAAPTATNTSTDTTQGTAAPTATNTSPDTTQGTAAPTATNTSTDTTQSTAAPTATNTITNTTQSTAAPTATNTSPDTTQSTAASTDTDGNPSSTSSFIPTTGTDVPESYPMPIENLEIPVEMRLKHNTHQYNSSLDNSDDKYYQQTKAEMKHDIEIPFNITGFQNVTITGFWNGSLGINFTVYFKSVHPRELKEKLRDEVLPKLRDGSPHFNNTFLDAHFSKDIDLALNKTCTGQLNKCQKDYKCVMDQHLEPLCEHVCAQKQTMCQNGGQCVVDREYDSVCRCSKDADFVYGGDYCEEKVEKLALKKEYIIAIAAGGGGGIVLILVVIIIVICKRNGQKKRPQSSNNVLDNASEQSYRSFKGSEDGVRQPTTVLGTNSMPAYDNPMFRLSEERAENPRFNPYLTQQNLQHQNTNQMRQEGPSVDRKVSQRSSENTKQSRPEPKQFQDRVPNYGDPAQLPRLQPAPSTRDYLYADNKPVSNYGDPAQLPRFQPAPSTRDYLDTDNKHTFIYQPTKPLRPVTENQRGGPIRSPVETKVYDYYDRREPVASGFNITSNDTHLYDFDYENNIKQGQGIRDPYSIKRPLVSSRAQY